MYTKEQLKEQLLAMGIEPTDTVMLHTSLRALGPVEGGADTVIDAFKEVLTDGLLVIPGHTWADVPRNTTVFNVRTSVPCTGTMSVVAASRPDGFRSLHPTHSCVAFGKDAEAFVQGDEVCDTPTSPLGTNGKLLMRRAKVLLVGVGHERDTVLHCVEEMELLPNRLTQRTRDVTVIGWNGEEYHLALHQMCRSISRYFPKFEVPFAELGAQKEVRFGDARTLLCDSVEMMHIMHFIELGTTDELCADDEPLDPKLWANYPRRL